MSLASIKVEGIEEVIKSIRVFDKTAIRAIQIAVNDIASDIFRDSQEEVPFDEGVLKESGWVEWAGIQGGTMSSGSSDVEAQINYGGSNSPAGAYAVAQHEGDFNHPTPGTKRKYLEDPAEAHRKHLPQQIIKEIKRAR